MNTKLAIECLKTQRQFVDDMTKEALSMTIKALEAQKWIPCSERLPEVGRSVLFSRRSMYTREGCLQADGKWWQYWWDEMLNADQVTAWKPLPEPYREDGDGDEDR